VTAVHLARTEPAVRYGSLSCDGSTAVAGALTLDAPLAAGAALGVTLT
jgi:hypothetical protein